MGLKLRQDILKPLQQSGGNIVLPNSLVTLRDINAIEGQQFETGTLQVAGNFASLPANTLHFVYLVAPSSVPQLVISTNVNSVGPAGFNAWQLVGAFYTNGLGTVDFGRFLGINGMPQSNEVPFEPVFTTPTGSLPTMSHDSFYWWRYGKTMFLRGFTFVSATGSGAANPVLTPPSPYTLDGSQYGNIGGSGSQGQAGGGSWYNDSSTPIHDHSLSMVVRTDGLSFITNPGNDGSPTFINANIANEDRFSFTARIEITEWDDTPLRDL